jgi:calcineurin-like phosphoesterase family protein
MRKLLALGTLAAALILGQAVAVAAKPFSIAVYGDSPYGTEQVGTTPADTAQLTATPAFIDSINADPDVSLVLNVGDIHSGSQFCTQAYDQRIFDLWTRFQDPLVYTPGDNEWADCHKKKQGGGEYNAATGQIVYQLDANGNPINYAKGDPIANLQLVRSIFFPRPGLTLGARKQVVLSQAHFARLDRGHPSDAKYVENVLWVKSGVVFVTINLPGGSNNDTDTWYKTPAQTAAQQQEIAERTGADLRWLDVAFRLAQIYPGIKGVVVAAQADMWDNEAGPTHEAAYEPFVRSLASHATSLGRPVLMFNGDSHIYLSDNPLSGSYSLDFVHPGYHVPNFHQVVVHGSTFPLEWLKLTVDTDANAANGPSAFGPFSWVREIQP